MGVLSRAELIRRAKEEAKATEISASRRISALARLVTGGDGGDLVQFFSAVMKGEIRATTKERLEAARWLSDRGYGRVAEMDQSANPEASAASDALSGLTRDQLRALATGVINGNLQATLALVPNTQVQATADESDPGDSD